MQMIFQRDSITPATRPQPRRGTFALEPVEALPRLSEGIRRLAARSLEANPFFLPEFLEPAIRGLGKKAVRLAVFSDRDDLHFFAPVVVGSGQVLGGRSFSVWAHPYAPLGAPLIDRESAPQVTDSLIAHMRTTGRGLFSIPHLPLKGPAAEALRAAARRSGFSMVAERQMRPILYPDMAAGIAEFDKMVNQKRRRELDRQMRRLCEVGAVSFMSAKTASEIENAFGMFIALEASGWKGRRGTALARKQSVLDFSRTAVAQLAQSGNAMIDVLRLGDRPIAALIRFDLGGLSIPWKVAFDEEYAAYSPGKQLMCDETRRWLADPTIERVDPVCEEDNPLMAPLWPDREPYGTLLISSGRWGVAARWRAGVTTAKAFGKANIKQLLARSGARRKKPAAKDE
jgi:CelD/BcsL family acetyltransferase involved in cellulose biosynthesis